MRAEGLINPYIKRQLRGRYFAFNQSFCRRSGQDQGPRGIKFLVTRDRKAITIADDSAPLARYYGREYLKFRAGFQMDAGERRLYTYDIELQTPVTKETLFVRTDVPLAEVVSVNFAHIRRLRIRRIAYKLTLRKRG